MKKMLLLLTLFLSFISAYAAENLIMNGNFSERDDDWKGDVSIKKLDGNLCL